MPSTVSLEAEAQLDRRGCQEEMICRLLLTAVASAWGGSGGVVTGSIILSGNCAGQEVENVIN